MRAFDLSPLFRQTVGFDRLASLIDSAHRVEDQGSYPPYNIEKHGEDAYRITLAVAGFAEHELSLVVKGNSLVVSGKHDQDPQGVQYLHRGIAARAFERRFELADTVSVVGARLDHGLLFIELKRVVPEALRPRLIPIEGTARAGAPGAQSGTNQPVIDADAA
ncbi:MAG: Hsp20 family protein [Alphaproteobacteria bacterium]|nr:Hsp20 family protein [Alphaproteobacteria bacterium]